MSEKRTILNLLKTRLEGINGQQNIVVGCPLSPYTYLNTVSPGNVYSTLQFLDQINDWPTICLYQESPEIRQEFGLETFAYCSMRLRCYLNTENVVEQADDLIEDLQYCLNSFSYTLSDPNLIDLKILQTSSDEGLLEPLGIVEISFLLAYKLTI